MSTKYEFRLHNNLINKKLKIILKKLEKSKTIQQLKDKKKLDITII